MSPRLTLLDVGHGNAAILEDKGKVAVFDAGSRGCLPRFLREQTINRIETLILSHADADHIGGAVSLLSRRQLSIGRIATNADAIKQSLAWDELSLLIDERSRDPRDPLDDRIGISRSNGSEFDIGDVHVEIVGPRSHLARKGVGGRDPQGRRIAANSLSVVVRLHHAGRPLVLLPGDLDEIGLDSLQEIQADLRADVLVYPHHGGRGRAAIDTFATRLLLAVQPRFVFFSIGRGVHSTPRPEIVETIRRSLPQARIACTQLSEHCAATLPTRPATHLAIAHAYGKDEGRCCAGTVHLHFGQTLAFEPSQELHGIFVDALGHGPLCRKPLVSH